MLDERPATQPFEWIRRGDPAARHALLAISPSACVLAVSPKAQQWFKALFGRDLAEGDDLRVFTQAAERLDLERDLARALRGEPVWLVRELTGPAGSAWLEIDYHPVRQRDGTLEAILLLIAPVSADRLSGAIVRQAERRFRDILSEAGLAAVTLSREGMIDYCNAAFAGLIGVPREALLGRCLADFLVSEADRDRIEKLARGTGAERTFDALLRTAAGQLRQVSWSTALRREPEAAHVGVALVCHDLSERQQANARIAAAQKMAAIGKLAARAAHEINNPLALLQANTLYLREQLLGTRHQDAPPGHAQLTDMLAALDETLSGITRIRDIVSNLRAFAKAVPLPDVADVDLRHELLAAVTAVGPALRERATVELSVPPELPPLRCEPGALTRAFTQILTNSAQAIPEGDPAHHKVRIDAHAEDHQIHVQISDTGAGISEDAVARIFEPFFTTRPGAAGLGLAVTRAILSNFGGVIDVHSTPGKGATFHVRMPLPSAAPPPVTRPEEIPRRVLVVDDEPMIGRAIRRMLAPDYEVFAVTTANEALAELSVHAFDAVLCDLALPDISGMEFRRKVEDAVPALLDRLVFITGGAYTAEAQRFLERSDVIVLTKPLEPQTLRATVAKVTGARP